MVGSLASERVGLLVHERDAVGEEELHALRLAGLDALLLDRLVLPFDEEDLRRVMRHVNWSKSGRQNEREKERNARRRASCPSRFRGR